MKIDVIPTGRIQENCYIATDEQGTAAVIDPGDDAAVIIDFLQRNRLHVEWILITHGHFDHIGALASVQRATEAKVAVHAADKGTDFPVLPDKLVEDGDQITCGRLTFTVVTTPGHTPGCVLYLCEDAMFSGDTLFYESIGRTDLAGGDFTVMRHSLVKIRDLPYDDLAVYPGHMQQTTLRHERQYNPFFGI